MTRIHHLSQRLSSLVLMSLRLTQKEADQKKLLRHIMDLNQKHSTEEIIRQSADCLSELLDYQVLAFAISQGAHAEVWMDPLNGVSFLMPVIEKDFKLPDQTCLKVRPLLAHSGKAPSGFAQSRLIACETRVGDHVAKIYLIPGEPERKDRDEVIGLILESCSFAILRQMNIDRLANAAIIDPLTGCYNRREFETQLKRTISHAIRHKIDLSVFILDLDHFKKVNDVFGHPAGDEVLRQVAGLVQNDMRKDDIFARYGGEEFIAILPGTGKRKALELAERLRLKISGHAVEYHDRKIRVTASFGVASLDHDAGVFTDMKLLIKRADNMLYKAKLKGRNMVMPGLIKLMGPENEPQIKQTVTA